MNWKNTWILVGLAAALFAFIFLFERRLHVTGYVAPVPPLFANFKPTAATSVQLRRGTQFAMAVNRTNGSWRFVSPFSYPAANFPVQSFLEALEKIVPAAHISARDMKARRQSAADFGFDTPPIVVALENGNDRRELRFGARLPTEDQLYVEIVGQPGYFVVGADIMDRLPRTQHDWRDTALFHFGEEKIDHCEIMSGGAGFALQLDSTNQLWRLARPDLRADQIQVRELLHKLEGIRALEFVTDDPKAEADAFGLQPPEFELTLTSGTSVQKVQFGHAATNDPGRVYARVSAHTNVVLVPKSAVDLLATPYSSLRERQLVAFAPELVDIIEVGGEEPFVARKNAAGNWLAGEMPADALYIEEWLVWLSQLQVTEFVKDVVTDFAAFGLAPAQKQYTLRTSVTNAVGTTNVLVAQIDFGTNITNRAYARRLDEKSVYGVQMLDFIRLPSAAWQLHDHRVWSFTTNQVTRILVRQGNATNEVIRQPNGEWTAGAGWTGDVNPFALEETTYRLGLLQAFAWMGRGDKARAQFGFTPHDDSQIIVELRGEKPQTLTLDFGGISPLGLPYASTTIAGQTMVFMFPWPLYADLQRYFHLAAPAGSRPRVLSTPVPARGG